MSLFETSAGGAATAPATPRQIKGRKGQKCGRRRPRIRPAVEESNDEEAERHPGPFNLIAKTSEAFLQALCDYQLERDTTARSAPEEQSGSREATAEEGCIDEEEEEDTEDTEGDYGGDEEMDCSAKTGDYSPSLTSLGARCAWRRLRLHITEAAMKSNNKDSVLGWRFLRLAVSSLSNVEKTRQELYERYIDKPESWTDALVNCPDHLRFRNAKTCLPSTKVPCISSLEENSQRWSPLSARNRDPSHVTGRSSTSAHVTGCARSLSGVVARTVDARTERDLSRTRSAFVRKPRKQSSTRRGESAKARFIF